jgi:hypothetical protein
MALDQRRHLPRQFDGFVLISGMGEAVVSFGLVNLLGVTGRPLIGNRLANGRLHQSDAGQVGLLGLDM